MRASSLSWLVLVAVLIAGPAWGQEQRPGWLGVQVQDVAKEEAERLGWKAPRGVKVTGLPDKGSPAKAAGLVPGDVIVAFDDNELNNAQALRASLAGRGPGTAVRVRLTRAGKELTVAVTLGARPREYDLNQQAAQLYSARKYKDGLPVAQQAAALAEQRLGPDDDLVAVLLSGVADFHGKLGRHAEAASAYKRALAIKEKVLGSDHPDLVRSLNNLAFSYLLGKRHADAEALYQRSLAIQEKAPEPDNVLISNTLADFALLYASQGLNGKAEQHYRRSLAMMEKARGPEHLDVRAPLESVAGFHERRSRYAEAEPLRKRALAITEKALGPDDPDLGKELGNLASVYEKLKRYADAEPLYWRWLAIVEKTRGPGHLDAQRPLDGLAALYETQKRYAEAVPLRERALANIKQARGAGHMDVQRPLDYLALVYEKLGRHGEAEALRKEWLAAVESARGPEHPDVQRPLGDLARFYQSQHRYAEAAPLFRRALAIAEKAEGPDNRSLTSPLDRLAAFYKDLGRFAEAEPLYKRILALKEKERGTSDSSVRLVLRNLVEVYRAQGRYAEAEAMARRRIAMAEKEVAEDPSAGRDALRDARDDLAQVLREANRLAEAEKIYRGALASAETNWETIDALLDLADFLSDSYRLAEAEPLYRRALALADDGDSNKPISSLSAVVRAKNALAILLRKANRLAEAEALFLELRPAADSVEAVDPVFASILGNFGLLLEDMGRPAEAEALVRRALAIDEKLYGPDHPKLAVVLNNLAGMLHRAKRYSDAEPLARRSLAVREKVYGPEHPKIATALNTLALTVERAKGSLEAEPLLRRSIAIDEKVYGPDHPSLAAALNNLALLTYQTGRLEEAEALMRRALFINKRTLGPRHPDVASDLGHLAVMRGRQGDWAQAAALHAHAKPALIGPGGNSAANDRAGLTKALLKQHSGWLRLHADALNRANANSAAARAEGFELAQWALQTDAAEAVTQMSARFAKGDGPLAALVRERQSLVARRQSEDRRMLAAIVQADPKAVKGIYASRDDSKRTLESIDAALVAKFPEYADLANPKPLSLAATQALLRTDEALILFLDGPQIGEQTQVQEATLAWVVTKTKVSWHRIPMDTRALADQVSALRCGLDATLWDRAESKEKCRVALKGSGYEGFDGSPTGVLPFDLERSHALYKALLGSAESLLKGKHLLIVASGPLTSLPFGVLVTEPPKGSAPAALDDYRGAAWLGTRQPISVLPSAASLAALRRHARASQAAEPFVGFGAPALQGNVKCGPPPAIPDRCPDEEVQVARGTHIMTRSVQSPAAATSYFRGGLANVDALRGACPLPDTAYELRCVARSLGATPAAVVIGNDMTETAVKAAPLDRYRIVHFATHGLLAGETALFARDRAEPALVMSPPDKPTEADDGLLTASEVAGLKLDADWVVLSACNTAGGQGPGAEALSGLARAFFYAGARALLVSHWYVNSDAATLLASRTFAEMRSSARVGRAEAFRRAMLALISDDRRPWDAHPSAWAPFVVVGEGANPQGSAVARPAAKARGATAASATGKRRDRISGSQ